MYNEAFSVNPKPDIDVPALWNDQETTSALLNTSLYVPDTGVVGEFNSVMYRQTYILIVIHQWRQQCMFNWLVKVNNKQRNIYPSIQWYSSAGITDWTASNQFYCLITFIGHTPLFLHIFIIYGQWLIVSIINW